MLLNVSLKPKILMQWLTGWNHCMTCSSLYFHLHPQQPLPHNAQYSPSPQTFNRAPAPRLKYRSFKHMELTYKRLKNYAMYAISCVIFFFYFYFLKCFLTLIVYSRNTVEPRIKMISIRHGRSTFRSRCGYRSNCPPCSYWTCNTCHQSCTAQNSSNSLSPVLTTHSSLVIIV